MEQECGLFMVFVNYIKLKHPNCDYLQVDTFTFLMKGFNVQKHIINLICSIKAKVPFTNV